MRDTSRCCGAFLSKDGAAVWGCLFADPAGYFAGFLRGISPEAARVPEVVLRILNIWVMKRLIFSLLLLAGIVAGGCRRSTAPRFETVVADTVVVRGGVTARFQYAFATIVDADKVPALQAIEEADKHYFFGLEYFRGDVRQAVDASVARFMEEYVGDLPEQDPDWTTELELTVESDARAVDSLLVFTILRSSYTGGAHGMYSIECHNYSLAGGYELALADLFDLERQAALREAIRRKLYERFDVAGDEGLAELGFFPEYIAATENFEVADDGITFYYNPYDIGCYALGGVEVHLTRDELQRL